MKTKLNKITTTFSRLILVTILVCGLTTSAFTLFRTAKASTEITGIISLDTTWTKTNSPYILTGPILVSNGATLTIEPGVTVHLNEYYIRVNGTLVARGTNTDKIHFEPFNSNPGQYLGTQLEFTSFSTDWNEQTKTGSIIENAFINSDLSISNSPKVNINTINARIRINGDSSVVISNNTITDQIIIDNNASAIILNNNIISEKDYMITLDVVGGSAAISNNNITGHGDVGNIGISIEGDNQVYISDNIISGFQGYGIRVASDTTIERNSICRNKLGILIGEDVGFGQLVVGAYSEIIIRNNTIKDNSKGIYGSTSATTIIYNNIQNNSDYNVGLRHDGNINATLNWWGTNDTNAINQTILDFKNDFNLGTVKFVPFLTEPNKEAQPIPEFPSWTILPFILTGFIFALLWEKRLRESI